MFWKKSTYGHRGHSALKNTDLKDYFFPKTGSFKIEDFSGELAISFQSTMVVGINFRVILFT